MSLLAKIQPWCQGAGFSVKFEGSIMIRCKKTHKGCSEHDTLAKAWDSSQENLVFKVCSTTRHFPAWIRVTTDHHDGPLQHWELLTLSECRLRWPFTTELVSDPSPQYSTLGQWSTWLFPALKRSFQVYSTTWLFSALRMRFCSSENHYHSWVNWACTTWLFSVLRMRFSGSAVLRIIITVESLAGSVDSASNNVE
jgi:hypothetical protein